MPAYLFPNDTDFLVTRTGQQSITGSKIFLAGSASSVPLTVQGIVSQTGNLQEWRNDTGAIMGRVMSNGAIHSSNGLIAGSLDSLGSFLAVHIGSSPAQKGMTVRAAASQTANISEWQNSAGSVLSAVTSGGIVLSNIGFQGSGTAYLNMQSNRDPMVYLAPSTATSRPLVIRGAASQTANMFEVQDSTGANRVAVTASGHLYTSRTILQDDGASGRGVIHNPDSRSVNDAPGMYNQGVRWDFKGDATIGLPTTGGYNGLMSYSLWGDDSGGGVFQLAFGMANNASNSTTGGGRTAGNIWMRYGTRAGGWQAWRPFNLSDTSWAIIGDAGSPAFETGWVHYYSATQEPLAFRKLTSGAVKLKGLTKNPAAQAAGSIIFTLPVGYRPAHYMRFAVTSHTGTNGGFGRIDIGAGGQVYYISGNVAEMDLSSVTFLAEA